MPPLAPSTGSIKVQMIGTNQGALWMNQLFFQTEAGAAVPQDTSQISTFLGAIQSAWAASIAPLCNTTVSFTGAVFTDLTSLTAVQFTATFPTPTAGTRAGTNLPTSAAMVISWRVSNRYRGGHGRIYVPGGVQADLTNGRTWTGAFTNTASGNAETFRSTINGLSVGTTAVNHVVLSYFSGSHKTPANPHPAPVPRATPLPMPVTSAKVRTRLDSQRGRLGKETI